MLSIYCADLFEPCDIFHTSRDWFIVVDYKDSVAEVIKKDRLLQIWDEHNGWLKGRYRIGMNNEFHEHQKIFKGVFGKNHYEGYNYGRQYFLSGDAYLDKIRAMLSFYLDGFKFICIVCFLYVGSTYGVVDVVLCFDDDERFLGLCICGDVEARRIGYNLKAAACDEKLKALIPKWAMCFTVGCMNSHF